MEFDCCRVKDIVLRFQPLAMTLNCAIHLVNCTSLWKTSDCRYDGGPLLSYLQKVKAWLDTNPNEGSPSPSLGNFSSDNSVHESRRYRRHTLGQGLYSSRDIRPRIRPILYFNPLRHSLLANPRHNSFFRETSSHIPRLWRQPKCKFHP
jgi:hypothetical protein